MNFKDLFNFDEYDYFYHMTSIDYASSICEKGLLVNGNNILDTTNILFTTAIPISEDMLDNFADILSNEMGTTQVRDTDACIIIGSPKESNKDIVNDYNSFENEKYYEGIISKNMIMGYIDLDKVFHINENYEFFEEDIDDLTDGTISVSHSIKR